MQKILGPKKNSLALILHVQTFGWSGTEKCQPLAKHTAQREQGFEFKVS
jgi:hypothetical protein